MEAAEHTSLMQKSNCPRHTFMCNTPCACPCERFNIQLFQELKAEGWELQDDLTLLLPARRDQLAAGWLQPLTFWKSHWGCLQTIGSQVMTLLRQRHSWHESGFQIVLFCKQT